MTTKTRKGTGTRKKPSTRTTTSVKPGGVAATSSTSSTSSTATRTGAKVRARVPGATGTGPTTSTSSAPARVPSPLLKVKRVPDAGPGAPLRPSPLVGGTPEQIRARDQLLDTAADAAGSGFAARFARAVRRIGEGVTIGVDANLNVVVTRNASTEPASASGKGHPTGPVLPADRLADPRMRDLDQTVRVFMRETEQLGLDGPARARFAAAVLGVVAKDGTKVEAVADAAIDGLLSRLNGKASSSALPKDVATLLTAAVKAWRSTSEADFWTDMAAAAKPADGVADGAFLHEQAAWMGLVAKLGEADLKPPPKADETDPDQPPWTWNTAAEKADLVDTLVAAAAGADNPAEAVFRRLQTLTRGADPLPRAIAAELAQLAFAALAGVKAAPALDRTGVLRLKERDPGPNATQQEQTEHNAREVLRSIGQVLVARAGLTDPLHTDLYRNKLSALYADMKQMLREYQPADPTDESDLPGEQRLDRLMGILGTFDKALVDGLDAWSAAIASGSTDAADYVAKAASAKAALDGVLQRMKDAKDGATTLYGITSRESTFVAAAVEMLSAELAREAGEVLLGQLAPPAEPAAGLRKKLEEFRGRDFLAERMRQARDRTKQKTVTVARTLPALKPKPAWVDKLAAAATAFDAENNKKPADPVVLAASAAALVAAGTEARLGAAKLTAENERQAVVGVLDRLYLTAAEELRRVPPPPGGGVDPAAAEVDRLTGALSPIPQPAQGVGLGDFWSGQKAAALRALPMALRSQIDQAMSLDLRDELEKLDKAATRGDDAATETAGWAVMSILRTYRTAVNRLPNDRADTRARLLAALDGVAVSVERRLTPPSQAPGAG
jgi:hypothetical protein